MTVRELGEIKMATVIPNRMAGRMDGDFVVFIIGARINSWWKPWRYFWILASMPKMLRELSNLPEDETGFIGYTNLGVSTNIQYWRSFEQLEAYAKARDRAHLPYWAMFNKRMKTARGDLGIWHETYLVKAGQYEAVYSGMPPHGLGAAGTLEPATGHREAARGRLGATD